MNSGCHFGGTSIPQWRWVTDSYEFLRFVSFSTFNFFFAFSPSLSAKKIKTIIGAEMWWFIYYNQKANTNCWTHWSQWNWPGEFIEFVLFVSHLSYDDHTPTGKCVANINFRLKKMIRPVEISNVFSKVKRFLAKLMITCNSSNRYANKGQKQGTQVALAALA